MRGIILQNLDDFKQTCTKMRGKIVQIFLCQSSDGGFGSFLKEMSFKGVKVKYRSEIYFMSMQEYYSSECSLNFYFLTASSYMLTQLYSYYAGSIDLIFQKIPSLVLFKSQYPTDSSKKYFVNRI